MSVSYFGRAWKIKVTPQTGEEWTVSNSDWDTEALRVTFDIEQHCVTAYWSAEVVIYNFLPALVGVIQKGDLVTVIAGYQAPGSGLIFSGKVFQPLWEREGETDYKLTLHCLIGLFEDQNGYSTVSIAGGTSQSDAVRQVAASSSVKILVEYLDPILDTVKPPKGRAFAGYASRFFCEVAASNHMQYWMGWNGINISSLAPQGDTPNIVYAPPFSPTSQSKTVSGADPGFTKYTLIGTPQQTELGISCKVLLDSDLRLGCLMKLDMALLRLIPQQVGAYPLVLDKDGIYIVAGIRHIGDTRGRPWYSEITAVTREFSKLQAVLAR